MRGRDVTPLLGRSRNMSAFDEVSSTLTSPVAMSIAITPASDVHGQTVRILWCTSVGYEPDASVRVLSPWLIAA